MAIVNTCAHTATIGLRIVPAQNQKRGHGHEEGDLKIVKGIVIVRDNMNLSPRGGQKRTQVSS